MYRLSRYFQVFSEGLQPMVSHTFVGARDWEIEFNVARAP